MTDRDNRVKSVYLVDDEPEMTQLVSALLKFKGYDLSFSNDPEEAVESLMTRDYDALIIDLMMPRLDGLAIIEQLRAQGKRLPIVVLSAKNLDDEERKKLLSLGVRFVAKPIAPNRLVQIVREAVESSALPKA